VGFQSQVAWGDPAFVRNDFENHVQERILAAAHQNRPCNGMAEMGIPPSRRTE
jgi:hypothetical protein